MNILDKYGIKEVADVMFYEINNDGTKGRPELLLDTLKVSTIEQNAETTYAEGGKGNVRLIAWDYGKELTVTLEDALFSAKSLAIMFGNGKVVQEDRKISKTETFTAADGGAAGAMQKWKDAQGNVHSIVSPKYYDAASNEVQPAAIKKGETYFVDFEIDVKNAGVVTISASTFPGTYYIVGDTYARNEKTGKDENFQFVIPKAKVTAENTITLEAEGDPSVFSMSLTVLRPDDGQMMQLIKYQIEAPDTSIEP